MNSLSGLPVIGELSNMKIKAANKSFKDACYSHKFYPERTILQSHSLFVIKTIIMIHMLEVYRPVTFVILHLIFNKVSFQGCLKNY
jgi:hypothetical protein